MTKQFHPIKDPHKWHWYIFFKYSLVFSTRSCLRYLLRIKLTTNDIQFQLVNIIPQWSTHTYDIDGNIFSFHKLVILSNFAIQNYYNLYEVYAKVPNTYFFKLGTEYIGENHVFPKKHRKILHMLNIGNNDLHSTYFD